MSHTLNLLQELLLTLFLALGCAWFAIDLARKLRAPQSSPEPHRDAAPATAPSTAAPSPVCIPAPVSLVAVAPAATPEPAAAVEPLVAGVPASHLAAITAAVHHLFKGRVRLASVLPAGGSSSASNSAIDWAREGRRDIFTSHRVR
jgi:hypothetical protein